MPVGNQSILNVLTAQCHQKQEHSMDPRTDLAADMMHNNLASHVETVQNAVHSSVDIDAWISNNSVTQINTPVKANIDLLEATRAVSAGWLRLAHLAYGFGGVRGLLG